MSNLKHKYLIFSKISLKIIWKIVFFDFIFAKEILRLQIKNYELPMMAIFTIYKNIKAMAIHFRAYSGQPASPSLDYRFYKTQVYEDYKLIG